MGHGKTVLLLGAGASRASDFTLPTLQGFFGDSTDGLPNGLRAFLQWFYPDRPPADYNLEELLSFLYLADTRIHRWTLSERPPYGAKPFRYRDLLPFIEERLSTPQDRLCTKHVALFKRCTPDDTVITLNYDTIADRALVSLEPVEHGMPAWAHRVGKLATLIGDAGIKAEATLSLGPRERQHGFFLKLHGSLDWLHCSNAVCSNTSVILSPIWSRFPPNRGDACNLCGSPIDILIMPPIASKAVDTIGRLSFLWSLAFHELRTAQRVVAIGVSFSPSDFELRWLIRESTEYRTHGVELRLVNPSDAHRATARSLFGTGTTVHHFKSLDDYLAKENLT